MSGTLDACARSPSAALANCTTINAGRRAEFATRLISDPITALPKEGKRYWLELLAQQQGKALPPA
jgi:hypothetical protein